ncbi:hypothetical protein [Prosthecochloris sp. HL-130-GSB]|jgi:hypothetical protein|uniref:hypothetical protein n=1 Tax=Prosthecochloris sp. HL-130-GSB TaxID=1974213 RepID=UPI0012F4C5E0|nr:hypothetical protein [Prosthecochloris sp. HL-130-GSB]
MSKSNKRWLTQDEVIDVLLYTAPDGQVAESIGAIPKKNLTGCSVIPRKVAESIGEVI